MAWLETALGFLRPGPGPDMRPVPEPDLVEEDDPRIVTIGAGPNYEVLCGMLGSWPAGTVLPPHALDQAGDVEELVSRGIVRRTTAQLTPGLTLPPQPVFPTGPAARAAQPIEPRWALVAKPGPLGSSGVGFIQDMDNRSAVTIRVQCDRQLGRGRPADEQTQADALVRDLIARVRELEDVRQWRDHHQTVIEVEQARAVALAEHDRLHAEYQALLAAPAGEDRLVPTRLAKETARDRIAALEARPVDLRSVAARLRLDASNAVMTVGHPAASELAASLDQGRAASRAKIEADLLAAIVPFLTALGRLDAAPSTAHAVGDVTGRVLLATVPDLPASCPQLPARRPEAGPIGTGIHTYHGPQ